MLIKRFEDQAKKMAQIITNIELLRNAKKEKETKVSKVENLQVTNASHQVDPIGYVNLGGPPLTLLQKGKEEYFPKQCFNVQGKEEANFVAYQQGGYQRLY